MRRQFKQLWVWLNAPLVLWCVLAWPSVPLVWDLFADNRYYSEIMHLSGVLSAQILVLTLAITPISLLLKPWPSGKRIGLWLLKRRRYFGVASFGYALLHVLYYIRESGSVRVVYLEFFDLDFLFGWIGFFCLLLPFLTSNRFSISRLSENWKPLQRLSYVAALGVFVHWLYFDFFWTEVLSWLAVLCVAKLFHLAYRGRRIRIVRA